MKTFLTGSYAYGVPHKESDIDLAVLTDIETIRLLWTKSDPLENSCRFGQLNLVLFDMADEFARWKQVTDTLIAAKPVSRPTAIDAFIRAGFTGYPNFDLGKII